MSETCARGHVSMRSTVRYTEATEAGSGDFLIESYLTMKHQNLDLSHSVFLRLYLRRPGRGCRTLVTSHDGEAPAG